MTSWAGAVGGVGKRVPQYIAQSRIALFGMRDAAGFAPATMGRCKAVI
ncbi:MAG TPA: hypothetical protein VFV38_42085 [Ktedonobacteraceae bacterium]|nr:hypothetical protein [Ktedonobacteraceae bacterium]